MEIKVFEDTTRRIGSRSLNKFVAEGSNRHQATSIAPASFFRPLSSENVQTLASKQAATESALVRILGKPYYSAPGFILFNQDCTEVMAGIKKAEVKVELTVTSPPYNIGKEYESIQSVESFTKWCEGWLSQIYSITSDRGAFWHNLGYFEVPGKGLCVPIPYLLWDKVDFYLIQEVVWTYGAGVTSKHRLAPRNEKWLFYVKDPENYVFNLDEIRDPNVKYPNQKKNGKFRCNPLGKNPSDVWEFPKVTTGSSRSSKERTGHPAQFPLGVVERVIRSCSNNSDIVLDPFAGSCSAGVAAVAFGRLFIGSELRKDYCDLSIKRYQDFCSEKESQSAQGSLLGAAD